MIPLLEEAPDAAWDDARLVAACLEGDAAAWHALIDKYKRLIYAIPFRYGAAASDADDIFQNVCVELYDELPRLRQAGALRGWLSTVTARQSLKWKQQNQRRGETGLEDAREPAAEDDGPAIELLERGQIVHEALARIPERCQKMLRLLFFEDPPRPYDEVAKALGLAKGSIGFIRGRCMEKLRAALEEAGF
jgi:RNA polymerase sigma factor (sigma-70 family)